MSPVYNFSVRFLNEKRGKKFQFCGVFDFLKKC